MFTILTHLKNRYLSQKAQGIVEYALILAFVVVLAAVLTSDTGLSGAISSIFGKATTQLNGASASASASK
ncbi:MAG: pilin protein [Anaerovibrio sp.]|uniref:Flp family type IVb pilin n=1 Tax=Anaerovibrio sp. TaxID=1872532 RepID=UPI00260D3560|nr:pilin protein [Anaerovibrio sp.]MDD7677045.1 pilin protein [Anaerovibrio sp.]MDY2603326.1 pilin protein [Anaerovibrio sp.]